MDTSVYNMTSFFVAGSARSGNTSIFHCLNNHPALSLRPLEKSGYFSNDILFENGTPRRSRYDISNGLDNAQLIYGEVSSNYFHHPSTISRIAQYNSSAKIIISLRNPAERAFSHWQSEVFKGNERRPFHAAINEEIKSLNTYTSDQSTRCKLYLYNSCYADQIEHLRQYFDPHQLLFIKSEELRDDTEVSFYRILQFLGVPFIDIDCSAQNVGFYDSSLSVKDKILVQKFLRHDIHKTQKLLSWQCDDWLDALNEQKHSLISSL